MKLRKLDYSQFAGQAQEWSIMDCTFGDINLIVGRNATGKTRTLDAIRGLSTLLSETGELKWNEGSYNVTFEQNGEEILYTLEYHKGAVTAENLVIDSKTYLTRESDGKGEIFAQAEELDKNIRFQTPVNQVAASAKRDSIQHPFLENLYQWGEGLRRYNFGTPLGKGHLVIQGKQEQEQENGNGSSLNLKETHQVVQIFQRGEKEYSTDFVQSVIENMANIGYQLEDIGVEKIPNTTMTFQSNIPVTPLGLYVKEADRHARTDQFAMSQGMFRALSILIQINYSLLASSPSCILIDDIGEGLDFGRSSSLIKLLVEKLRGSPVQLIMTTNDRFIMNNVPLEFWIILERKGEKCIHHNYRNSRQMFDDFELTGLNNFDLFSSNYYLQNESKS